MRIFSALRCGDSPPSCVTHFESELDKRVQMAWKEQREIGWDQILKGRLSRHWGEAQGMFYNNSPKTRGNLGFSGKLWAAATVTSLLDFSLNLWNDRCDTLHGIDEVDAKRLAKDKVVKRVTELYENKEEIGEEYAHLFEEGKDKLIGRSIQYMIKWIASVRMAERVIARRKARGSGDNAKEDRRGGRGKSNKTTHTEGADILMEGVPMQDVRAYSVRHQIWIDQQYRGGNRHTAIRGNSTSTGSSGRPPEGM